MSVLLRDFTDALNTRLIAAAITGQIAWPNVVFRPRTGIAYLSVESAGRARTPLGFGADAVQQWSGIYQVSCFVPRDSGDREQDGIASKVLAAFPRGLSLPTPQGVDLIIELSTAASPVPYGDWSNLPVAVHWFAISTS